MAMTPAHLRAAATGHLTPHRGTTTDQHRRTDQHRPTGQHRRTDQHRPTGQHCLTGHRRPAVHHRPGPAPSAGPDTPRTAGSDAAPGSLAPAVPCPRAAGDALSAALPVRAANAREAGERRPYGIDPCEIGQHGIDPYEVGQHAMGPYGNGPGAIGPHQFVMAMADRGPAAGAMCAVRGGAGRAGVEALGRPDPA
ncbi:hypothetical protein AAHZ94_34210, partial [Streptomyces sp. HSW2009]